MILSLKLIESIMARFHYEIKFGQKFVVNRFEDIGMIIELSGG